MLSGCLFVLEVRRLSAPARVRVRVRVCVCVCVSVCVVVTNAQDTIGPVSGSKKRRR